MRLLVGIGFLLVSLVPPATASDLKWETDWSTAFARAASEDRAVFVDYYATWCIPCRHMEQEVFPAPQVAQRLERFVLLRIDAEKERRRALIDGVRGYPTYIVYDRWKTPRLRMTGTRSPERMADILDVFISVMPRITAAAAKLQRGESAPPHISLGAIYLDVGLFADATAEFEKARKVAVKLKDPVSEQLAIGELLLTRAMQGEAGAVVGELASIAASPRSDANALFAWMAVARSRLLMGDEAAMMDALERAKKFAPDAASKRAIDEAARSWGASR